MKMMKRLQEAIGSRRPALIALTPKDHMQLRDDSRAVRYMPSEDFGICYGTTFNGVPVVEAHVKESVFMYGDLTIQIIP